MNRVKVEDIIEWIYEQWKSVLKDGVMHSDITKPEFFILHESISDQLREKFNEQYDYHCAIILSWSFYRCICYHFGKLDETIIAIGVSKNDLVDVVLEHSQEEFGSNIQDILAALEGYDWFDFVVHPDYEKYSRA